MDKLSAFSLVKGKYQYQGIFGIKKEQFEKLFDHFYNLYKEETLKRYEERKKVYSSSDNGLTARLKYIQEERLRQYLHVTIYYLRHYPTLEVLGWEIGKTKQEACEIVHQWFVLLIKSLDNCKVLPARDLKHVARVAENLLGDGVIDDEELDLIIDVTERHINRPKKNQKAYYSGKKKHHSIKNTIISTTCAVVLFLGATHNGSVHDFTMLKEDCPKEQMSDNELFMNGMLWVDLGYQGILDFYKDLDIAIPYKKPRKSKKNPNPELTQEQKDYNSYVGRNRIRVEHSIGGIKISRIASHKFRGRKDGWNDDVMFAVTALYNYKKIY